MSDICREYISDVKNLFPIMRKQEKRYLSKLGAEIEELVDEENIGTKEALYERYGEPEDVVRDYISSLDTAEIIKKIKFSRHIKWLVVGLLSAVFIALVILAVYYFSIYQVYLQEAAVMVETVIE